MLVMLGGIFLWAVQPTLGPDLFRHLWVGGYIASHHQVPSSDFLSFTAVGHPWIDHQWLSELVMYGLYSLAGYWGPLVFFAAVTSATFGCVYAAMRQLRVYPFLGLFVVSVGALASSGSWGARPQMFTMLLSAVFVYLLVRYRRRRESRLLWLFPPLMLVWANLHGGFAVGLALLTLSVAGEWLNRRLASESNSSNDSLKPLAVITAISFPVTLINPHGFHLLSYPLNFLTPNHFTNLIAESASPNFHTPLMMAFELLLLVLMTSIFVARPKLDWVALLTILAFTHEALAQSRNVPLWVVVIGPLVALYVQQAWRRFNHNPTRVGRRRGHSQVLLAILLAVAALTYGVESSKLVSAQALQRNLVSGYPVKAAAYLQSHRLPPNIFDSYNWGGYLIGALAPRYKVFIDGRADSVYDNTILRDYLTAYGALPGWQSLLSRYRVQEVLVERNSPLSLALHAGRDWKLIFADRQAVLYSRRGSGR